MNTAARKLFGLTGRTALVTGARTGIGAASAIALAEAGADLVLWGRDVDALEDVAGEVRNRGRHVSLIGADLGDLEKVREVAADLASSQRIDILVNNAGTITRGSALDISPAQWRAIHAINLDVAFELSRIMAAPMIERRFGKIVNVTSLLAFQGGLNVAAYTSSKHALAGLTQAMANEWAGHSVNVNAVAPGYIRTNNTTPLFEDLEREAQIRARIPAGRWGEPEDVSGAVVFLCSHAARYIHGHTLFVDGGWMGR